MLSYGLAPVSFMEAAQVRSTMFLSEYRWISQFPKEKTLLVEMTTAFSLDVWSILIFSALAMLLLFYFTNELFLKIGFKPAETDYLDMLPFR